MSLTIEQKRELLFDYFEAHNYCVGTDRFEAWRWVFDITDQDLEEMGCVGQVQIYESQDK